MTNTALCAVKTRTLFIGSLALNIFLVAFLLGRASVFPPPHHGHPPREPNGMSADAPAPGENAPRPREEGPPRFLSPAGLFTPEEIKQNFAQMQPSFDKVHGLRTAFAEKLKTGSVSKEEALKHFSEVDTIMNTVKKQARAQAAEKISTMPEKERLEFADRLMRDPHPSPVGKATAPTPPF